MDSKFLLGYMTGAGVIIGSQALSGIFNKPAFDVTTYARYLCEQRSAVEQNGEFSLVIPVAEGKSFNVGGRRITVVGENKFKVDSDTMQGTEANFDGLSLKSAPVEGQPKVSQISVSGGCERVK